MRTTFPAVALALLAACGDATLYFVDVETQLVHEDGDPVRQVAHQVCMSALFGDGERVQGSCEVAVTDDEGFAMVSDFYTSFADLEDVFLSVDVDGNDLQGTVTSFRQSRRDEMGMDVFLESTYVVPLDVLPERVTRFSLVGSVDADREIGIPNATGTLYVDVSLDGGETVAFSGMGPVSTDEGAVYAADFDVVSYFWFDLATATITTRIDIDGYQGDGRDFVFISVDGDDPRVVEAFSSF